jgi:hypothetical protein
MVVTMPPAKSNTNSNDALEYQEPHSLEGGGDGMNYSELDFCVGNFSAVQTRHPKCKVGNAFGF